MDHHPANLLQRLGCPTAQALALADRVVQAIQKNDLPYHNLDHVLQTIAFATDWRHLTKLVDLVELALWFHDLVYDPQRHDNEAKSAATMTRWLAETPIPSNQVAQAADMILATHHHQPTDDSSALVVDADLSILAASPRRYAAYANAIRREYSWVNQDTFRIGRLAVLQGFLARPFIYTHRPIQLACESQARHNLFWEIKTLQ